MDYTTITFTADGPIGLLTLNRPAKLNALNQAMIEELDHLLGALSTNRDIRVVILTGAGEKGFCSGLDMTETAAQLFEVTPDLIYFYQTPHLDALLQDAPHPAAGHRRRPRGRGGRRFQLCDGRRRPRGHAPGAVQRRPTLISAWAGPTSAAASSCPSSSAPGGPTSSS